jgi:hypothetical protein
MVVYSTSAQVISCPPSPVFPRVEQTMAETVQVRKRLAVIHQCFHEVYVRGEVIYPPPPSEFPERLQYSIAVPNPHQQSKQIKRRREHPQDQHV